MCSGVYEIMQLHILPKQTWPNNVLYVSETYVRLYR